MKTETQKVLESLLIVKKESSEKEKELEKLFYKSFSLPQEFRKLLKVSIDNKVEEILVFIPKKFMNSFYFSRGNKSQAEEDLNREFPEYKDFGLFVNYE